MAFEDTDEVQRESAKEQITFISSRLVTQSQPAYTSHVTQFMVDATGEVNAKGSYSDFRLSSEFRMKSLSSPLRVDL